MSNATLPQHIEALLFTIGGPMQKKELAKKLEVSPEALGEALNQLKLNFEGRGLSLVDDGIEVELRASSHSSELIERVRKEEFTRDIGRAGLEVLAALLYRGPLSRSEIDFIRGVNSSQTLRTLLMRGFVRKVPNPRDERAFLYQPTTELLAELGIVSMSDLPQYEEVRQKLSELEAAYREKEQSSESSS